MNLRGFETDLAERPGAALRTIGIRFAWPALIGYVVVRGIGLIALWAWVSTRGHTLMWALTQRWDSVNLLQIAEHGYDPGFERASNLAFFPLVPMVERVLGQVVPGGPAVVGVAFAWLGGLACAWGLFAIGNLVYDARTGVVLAILWGSLPHAVVQSMAYSEAPFTALVVWSMYALLTRRWLTAAALCLVAGLTRPTAIALIGVVGLVVIVELVHTRGRNLRAWAAGLIAPLGWLAYLGWVGARVGRPFGWFEIQSLNWGSGWDGGRYTVTNFAHVLLVPATLQYYVVAAVIAVTLVLLVASVVDRQPWPLIALSVALVVIALGGSGYFQSKARFLMPAFALLLPPARALARAHRVTCGAVLSALVLFSAYFGAYLSVLATSSP